MAYNQFTLDEVKQRLGVTVREEPALFARVTPVPVSALLREYLQDAAPLALAFSTEKARSEMIIAPILLEVRRQRKGEVSLFSGAEFSVDPERGLAGFCDYLLSLSREQLSIEAPVVAVVEAKNENLRLGTPQCIAEMVAARIFNERRERPLAEVYGAVTTGDVWRFLRMRGATVEIDMTAYYLRDVELIVAVLLQMVRAPS